MSLALLGILAVVAAYFGPGLFRYFVKIAHLLKYGSKIPGPKAVPFFGNSLQVPHRVADWTPYFCGMANEYLSKGHNVIRLWMMDQLKIMPLNGQSMKDILESSEELTKSNDYDIVQPWLGTGLLIATGDKWRHRRRILTPTFHFSMLDGYVETFDKQSKLLVELLDDYAITGERVDVFPYIKRCALDVICETAMGYDLNSQREKNHPYATAVGEMGHIATVYGLRPYLWLPPVWHLLGYAKEYNRTLAELTDFTKDVIRDRKEAFKSGELKTNNGSKKAFLDMLLEMREQNSLSDEDIREEVDTFMFEGHDTTSAGIVWILWSLAAHQDIQQRVYNELFEVFGDSDREFTVADIKALPYLERVMKESMRLNPPVPFVGRVLANDKQIGDCLVPKGAQILISPLMVHSNEQVYPDPMKFDPDRFLPENSAKRHAYDYIPFSAGPRNCIGQKFALYEEKVMVAWVIRKFRISTDKSCSELGRCPEVVLRPEVGVPLKLERRK